MTIDQELQRAATGLQDIEVTVPAFERVAGRRRVAERLATVMASVLLLGGSLVAWQLGSARTSIEPGSTVGPGPCNELLRPDEVRRGLGSPTFSDPAPQRAPRTVHCIWPTADNRNGLGLHILQFDSPDVARQFLADDAARFANRVEVPNGFSSSSVNSLGKTVTTAGWVEGTTVLFADGSIPEITPADDLRFVQLAAARLPVLQP